MFSSTNVSRICHFCGNFNTERHNIKKSQHPIIFQTEKLRWWEQDYKRPQVHQVRKLSFSQDSDSINPVLLPSQLRCDEKKKKVYKKTFGKVVWKFSEDRPRRAGSTSYFTNCSLPAHSPGLRAAEQTCHCPGMAGGPGLSRSHLGGPQPRSPERVLTDPARYLWTGDDFYEKH